MNVEPLSLRAVLISYTISLAICIPVSGWMADRFGTRRVFAGAIALFTFASVLCGLSTNLYMLVACRVLQGCGAALMVPVGRLTLVRTYDKAELIGVLSLVTIAGWTGPILGPMTGAFIISHFHWGFVFFVNVPVGIAGFLFVLFHLPDYREKEKKPLDVVGLVLLGCGIALLSFVLEIASGVSAGQIVILLAISFGLIAGYWHHAAHTAFPLLQLGLFRIRTFSAAIGGSFMIRIAVGGVPFLLPLLYQVGLGYTPVQSGLFLMPQAFSGIGAKLFFPRLLKRGGYRTFLIANTVLLGSLLMLFATVGSNTPAWAIVLLAGCYGACTSLQYTTMNTMAYADIVDSQKSSAGSIASTAQELSISFGIASAGLAAAFLISEDLHSDSTAMMTGIHQVFLAAGVFTILSALIFCKLESGDGNVFSVKVDGRVVSDVYVREAPLLSQFLSNISGFGSLSPAALSQVVERMKPRPMRVGQELIRQGDIGLELFIIDSGSVEVLMTNKTGTRKVADLRRGDFFGERALISGEPRNATVRAKEDGLLYTLDKDSFQAALRASPTFMEQMSAVAFERQ
jgi:EmrB/QacA subfamily drug resistance transporter